MRASRITAAAVGAVLLSIPLQALLSTAHAAGTEGTPMLVEAWYHVSPLEEGADGPACSLLPACPTASTPVDAPGEGTLQVASALGADTARMFLALDLTGVPAGGQLSGGTLTLPLASAEDGTRAPETAELLVCTVTEPIVPAHGGEPEEAPAFDCETSAPAVYDEATESFSVNLEAVVRQWAAGVPAHGVAVVPAAEPSQPASTWRLVFSAKERTDSDARPITASVTFEMPATPPEEDAETRPEPVPPSSPDTGSTAAPADESSGMAPALDAGTAGPAPAPPDRSPGVALPDSARASDVAVAAPDEPMAAAPQPALPPPVAEASVLGPDLGFQYPVVWLTPLLLLLLGAWLGRAFTQDLTAGLIDSITAPSV